jgi:hypothetical protein
MHTGFLVFTDIHGRQKYLYPTRFYHGSGTGKIRGYKSVSETELDGSDIRRISEDAGKIAIPT